MGIHVISHCKAQENQNEMYIYEVSKVQKSPYYRGLELLDKLSENLQNELSKVKL